MRDHIFGHHAANRTEGLPAVSYAAKRAILSLIAQLRSVLQLLLRQQAQDPTRGSPRGQILELPPVDESNQGSPRCIQTVRGVT